MLAYGGGTSQVRGPSWVDGLHYDINARSAAPIKIGKLKRILQTLLIERFRLAPQRDVRERAVLGIVLASGGSKLAPCNPGRIRVSDLPLFPLDFSASRRRTPDLSFYNKFSHFRSGPRCELNRNYGLLFPPVPYVAY